MKKIVYKVTGYITTYNFETETEEQVECLVDAEKPYSEVNEEIVKSEAYNGEYTIEDDGQPEPIAPPTDKERLEALEAAMLEVLGVDL